MPRGRDKKLIAKRNEALLRRYHYWTEVQRLRFDDALRVLSEQEFFISEERILSIIRLNCRSATDIAAIQVPRVRVPRLNKEYQRTLFD